jgi:3-hydroxyisobutyrate dehydrogenase-like beta-hydroxyacid dehydrogenase
VGLGIMGSCLADSLIDAGFVVRGYDIDDARMDDFEAAGGVAARSPIDVASGCEIVVLSLLTSAISQRHRHPHHLGGKPRGDGEKPDRGAQRHAGH